MSVIDVMRRYGGAVDPTPADHDAHEKLLHGGGFSHHVRTGEEPTDGYMVSLHNDSGGDERVIPLKELTPEHIAEHRQKTLMTRAPGRPGDLYHGGWVHNGNAYLDRSINMADRKQAIEEGRRQKQLAIWDVRNGKEISLEGKDG